MTLRCLFPVVLLGCTPDGAGVSVGNPNKNTLLRVAPPGPGLELFSAEVSVRSITAFEGDQTRTVRGPAARDVLEGVQLGVPAGTWDAIQVDLDGVFALTGRDQDAALDLELDVPAVRLSVTRLPFALNEPHVFELAFPGWLTADEIGWTAGEQHVVRPDDPEHDVLVFQITDRSSLFADADGDGEPDG